MASGTLARCQNPKCGKLLIYGQTCTCGIDSMTGVRRVPPGTFECSNGHNRVHAISEDGNHWIGTNPRDGSTEKCRRRW